MSTPFAMVPVEACMDPRLTKMQLRLLICLLSFRAKNTDTIWPKRSSISERCGYTESVVSRVTSQLVDLGWLVKVGRGGFSKSCEYRITVPELVTVDENNGDQSGNGNQSGNPEETCGLEAVDKSVDSGVVEGHNSDHFGNGYHFGNGDQTDTNNGDQSGNKTVTSLVRGNKQTMNRPITDHSPATTTREAQSAKIAFPIFEDFMPSLKTVETLQDAGVTPDFLDVYLPRFITYWQDSGKVHLSWDSVFLEQCQKQFDKEWQPA